MLKNVFNEMISEKKEEKRNKRRELIYCKLILDILKCLYVLCGRRKEIY